MFRNGSCHRRIHKLCYCPYADICVCVCERENVEHCSPLKWFSSVRISQCEIVVCIWAERWFVCICVHTCVCICLCKSRKQAIVVYEWAYRTINADLAALWARTYNWMQWVKSTHKQIPLNFLCARNDRSTELDWQWDKLVVFYSSFSIVVFSVCVFRFWFERSWELYIPRALHSFRIDFSPSAQYCFFDNLKSTVNCHL